MKQRFQFFGYWFFQFIWGLPQSLAGLLLFLYKNKNVHFRYRSAIVTYMGKGAGSVSLGPFLFISGAYQDADCPEESRQYILRHEYGHTIQSLILGPLYFLIVGIPSILWCRVPAMGRSWRRGQCSYYSFFTERNADWLGGNRKPDGRSQN